MPTVSEAAPMTAGPEDLRITIKEAGQVDLAGEALPLDRLTARLEERRKGYPGLGVVIQGAASLSYQNVTDVLDRCEAAQIQKIRLAVVVDPAAGESGTPRRNDVERSGGVSP
jgi:biopolymer transport protein ExbD